MSSVIIAGNTSGTITLDAPAVAGTTTLTLPATTGNIVTDTATQTLTNKTLTGATITVAATAAPVFAAYMSAATQAGTSDVWVKVQFNTEVFDTNSNYDTGTYRFTPTVAGYYQVNFNAYLNASVALASYNGIALYKNGSIYTGNALIIAGVAQLQVSQIIYCNGSTDYIEAYFKVSGGSGAFIAGGATVSMFSAAMIRSA